MSKCKEDAIKCIARKSYHSQELARKLREKGHFQEEIQSAIDDLVRLGYLNDEEYLRGFSRKALEKGFSPLEIRSKLYQKGIAGSVECDENQAIKKYIQRKKFKDPIKMKQNLYRKGFSSESINHLLGDN